MTMPLIAGSGSAASPSVHRLMICPSRSDGPPTLGKIGVIHRNLAQVISATRQDKNDAIAVADDRSDTALIGKHLQSGNRRNYALRHPSPDGGSQIGWALHTVVRSGLRQTIAPA